MGNLELAITNLAEVTANLSFGFLHKFYEKHNKKVIF